MTATNVTELVIGIIYLVFCFTSITLLIIHAFNLRSDLFTKERKSLSHRRTPPLLNTQYKRMTWLTMAAVAAYSGTDILSAYSTNFAIVQKPSVCAALTPIILFPYQIAKPLMYSVYTLRLHQCYGKSAFGYRKKNLWCFAITIVILYTIFAVIASYSSVVGDNFQGDKDGKFPYHCFNYVPESVKAIIGGLQILLDFVLAIGSIIVFQIPIKRLFKQTGRDKQARAANELETDTSAFKDKARQKMLYIGYKYKVLVICASSTTMIWVIIALLGQDSLTVILAGLDFVINMVCLMLMTPYYPDYKYYERLCFVCICCCAKRQEKYQSNRQRQAKPDVESTQTAVNTSSIIQSQTSTTNMLAEHPKTVDTMDQIEVIAVKTGDGLVQSQLS